MTDNNPAKKPVIGLLGLGAMGTGIAINLIKNNNLSYVYNRTTETARQFSQQHKIDYCTRLEEFANKCNVILISVSADADILEVLPAMVPTLQAGTVIIDTSTISLDAVHHCQQLCASNDVYFLDAPVSGGTEGAHNGQLVAMVGGHQESLKSVSPIMESFTKSICYMGESGNGQKTKAVNQIMAAGINQAVTEALAFSEAVGLDSEKVIEVLSGGAAGNWYLTHRGKSMLNGNYDPGFKVKLHYKDLTLCNQLLEQFGENRLPIIEMTLIHYQRLIDAGDGDKDISALFKSKQLLLNNI